MPDPVHCVACGNPEELIFHIRNRWCRPCTRRWYRAGRPESGPPPLISRYARIEAWRAVLVSDDEREVSKLAAGTAAEHLVCADLLLQGYRAFLSDQTCPFDVAVDVGRLVKIQVKSLRAPRLARRATEFVYKFSMTRSSNRRAYDEDSFELIALVALDIRRIAYLPFAFMCSSTISIRQPGLHRGKQFADFPFAKAIADLGVLCQVSCRRE